MRIKTNPNQDEVQEILRALMDNDGYCPCKVDKIKENKCPCKEFREKVARDTSGSCHCGLYEIVEDEHENSKAKH